jgi:glucokinase
VIGGGLAQAGPALFEPLGRRLDALLSFHRRPVLLRARLGDDAGLLGTALAARDLAARLDMEGTP